MVAETKVVNAAGRGRAKEPPVEGKGAQGRAPFGWLKTKAKKQSLLGGSLEGSSKGYCTTEGLAFAVSSNRLDAPKCIAIYPRRRGEPPGEEMVKK